MKCFSAWAVLALLFLSWTVPAVAQCAMCREAAAAQNEEAAAAFNRAILVLGAPPALFLAVAGHTLWRRNNNEKVAAHRAGLQ